MKDLILILVLLSIVAVAAGYIYRAKKRGVKCIGCPAGSKCGDTCVGCGSACGAHKRDGAAQY